MNFVESLFARVNTALDSVATDADYAPIKERRYNEAQQNSQLIHIVATAMLVVEVASALFALVTLNIPGAIVVALTAVVTYDAAVVFKNVATELKDNRQGTNEKEVTDNIGKVIINNFKKHSVIYKAYKQWVKPHTDKLFN